VKTRRVRAFFAALAERSRPARAAVARAVRPVLATVTGSGWVVLVVAAVSIVLSLVFGWQEFSYLGAVLLAALVIGTLFLFGGSSYGVFIELNPRRVVVGDRAMGRMLVTNTGTRALTPTRMELPVGRGNLTLLYRASDWGDIVFREEIDALVHQRGGQVHFLVGRRGSQEMPTDPLQPRALLRMVPDIQRRDIYLCGSNEMMDAVQESLHQLRVPPAQVHSERFSY